MSRNTTSMNIHQVCVSLRAALAITLAYLGTLSEPALARTIGIGALAAPRPALSVQVENPMAACSYHLATHLSDEGVIADADCQRFLRPSGLATPNAMFGFYAGLGLRGEASRAEDGEEHYRLRIPLGMQIDSDTLHISTFFEVISLLGPLPATGVNHGWAAGLRAIL